MLYTILKIDEDLDFGCEERPDGAPVMAFVTLQDELGEIIIRRIPDQYLYDANINEGDQVSYDGTLIFRK